MQNEHIQGLYKLPTPKLHLSSLWAWGSFSLHSPQEPKWAGLCTPASPRWKNFGVYLAAIHINLVCKYLTQSFKERTESKCFSDYSKLHLFLILLVSVKRLYQFLRLNHPCFSYYSNNNNKKDQRFLLG